MPFPAIIADIGGTSARWAFVPTTGAVQFLPPLPGFNPAVGDPGPMVAGVKGLLSSDMRGSSVQVHVYGAGCGHPDRQARMRDALSGIWGAGRIHVESDLLGAARALHGHDPGLALILGTGMNIGHYDGRALHCPMPSLGFVLGDEGSGADIGKHLLRAYFHDEVPEELRPVLFHDAPTVAEAIRQVHRGTSPQAWLARFTGAVAAHLDHPWLRALVDDRFDRLAALIVRYFPEGQRGEVRAVGSVALGLQDALGPALAAQGMRLGLVINDPLPLLVAHHAPQAGQGSLPPSAIR